MNKRTKKKLYTDKTFASDLETFNRGMKSRKIKKALIQSNEIKVGRFNLGVPYREMKITKE